MQFQVPQFIEIEDKIFGPLTFKQFIYVVGGAGLSFIIYKAIPVSFFAFLFIIPVLGFSIALAFYKVNNRPLINTVESALKYATTTKLYIWKKEDKKTEVKKVDKKQKVPSIIVPKISNSKLKDLSWSLDVHKKVQ